MPISPQVGKQRLVGSPCAGTQSNVYGIFEMGCDRHTLGADIRHMNMARVVTGSASARIALPPFSVPSTLESLSAALPTQGSRALPPLQPSSLLLAQQGQSVAAFNDDGSLCKTLVYEYSVSSDAGSAAVSAQTPAGRSHTQTHDFYCCQRFAHPTVFGVPLQRQVRLCGSVHQLRAWQ